MCSICSGAPCWFPRWILPPTYAGPNASILTRGEIASSGKLLWQNKSRHLGVEGNVCGVCTCTDGWLSGRCWREWDSAWAFVLSAPVDHSIYHLSSFPALGKSPSLLYTTTTTNMCLNPASDVCSFQFLIPRWFCTQYIYLYIYKFANNYSTVTKAHLRNICI